MRRLLLVAGIAAFSSAASAEDFNWSGFYAGAAGGYGFAGGSYDSRLDGLAIWSDRHDLDGGIIGGFVGYQHQFSNSIVLGIEADAFSRNGFDRSDLHASFADDEFEGSPLAAHVKASGTIRARLGYSYGRLLPFVTAGTAWASYDLVHENALIDKALLEPFGDMPTSHNPWGATFGIGTDFALTDRILIRGEYRYSRFTDGRRTIEGLNLGPGYDLETSDVIFGVGYRF